MAKKYGAITSSVNPDQVSTTIKGVVIGASAIIMLLAQQFFHITLSANDVASLGDELGIAASCIAILYGLVMKLLMYFFKVTPIVNVAIPSVPPAMGAVPQLQYMTTATGSSWVPVNNVPPVPPPVPPTA